MEAREIDALEGAVVSAAVAALGEDEVIVTLEGGAEGALPFGEVRDRASGEARVKVGDTFPVLVDQRLPGGRYVVSKDKAERLAVMERLEAAFRAGEVVEGQVVGETDGGFSVDVGLKGFLPSSQIGLRPVRDPEQVLGQTFSFKILRVNRERANVVLSRRVLLEAERDKALGRLKVDAIVEGTVRRVLDYGAFVDVGGIDGLLHVSDLSWGRVKHPSDVVKPGQKLMLKVLQFDKETRKLSLGLRQIQDDPWLEVPAKYPVGTAVAGMVISRTDYGCFIEVEPGVEGLVHSTGPMVTPEAKRHLEKAELGDDLAAVVVDLDLAAKRMSLVWKA